MQLTFPHPRRTLIHMHNSISVLLMLASQRIESVMDFSGENSYDDDVPTKRGAAPTLIEMFILAWVSGKSSTVLIKLDGIFEYSTFLMMMMMMKSKVLGVAVFRNWIDGRLHMMSICL